MAEWRNTRAKRIVASVTRPLFYAVNRPSMAWFGRALMDVALRCNGFAVTFPGSHGLTLAEERFLDRNIRGRSGGTFIDVGANSGAYTARLLALVPTAAIHAFEPHPATFRSLVERRFPENVRPRNAALADVPGEMTLFDFASHDGSTQASLSQESVGLFTSELVGHPTAVATLDDYMEAEGIGYVDLLKVDTEGYDLKVLQGARRSLASGKIGLIQFEFIPANVATKVHVRDFYEVLQTHTIYRLCLNGDLLPLGEYDVKRVECYVIHNLVAVPKHDARIGAQRPQ